MEKEDKEWSFILQSIQHIILYTFTNLRPTHILKFVINGVTEWLYFSLYMLWSFCFRDFATAIPST